MVEGQMRILVWSLTVLAGFATTVGAQPLEPRATVSGIFAAGRTWDDEGSLGTGPAIGGRIDLRIFETTSVEASVDRLSHDRSGGFFEAEGNTTLFGVSLVQRFGSSATQPYLLGGLHLASHSGSTTFDAVRTERDSTNFGYHFGGGIAFRIGERLEIGPETRFYLMQADDGSNPALAYWIGGRVGIRF
jgi:opacity protein-like surface antigen